MSEYTIFHPEISTAGQNTVWGKLSGSSPALAAVQFAKNLQSPLLIITEDIHQTQQMINDLRFFSKDAAIPILQFPDWETLPYDPFSPHSDIISQRLTTLYQLTTLQKGIVVTALSTVMHRLPPIDFLTK